MQLNIHRCDRCGQKFDYNAISKNDYLFRDGQPLTIVSCKLRQIYTTIHLGGGISNEIQIELCPHCMKTLLEKIVVDTQNNITLKNKMVSECNCYYGEEN